ncbi:NCS2 family permease [Anoxybacter fermentans]|uniref:NCS2 family permease n=1 Tax=Anoxybacter fermentans TaxID=1323375 RepID=UPI0022B2731C|nr:NCS2 family permease [Anoxybacter fermentans]
MAEVKTNVEMKDSFLERQFKLTQNGTNVKTEFIAGLTTFLTMAYIIFVNPSILSATGMDAGAVYYATIFGAILGTLCMAFFANYPFALAPGMGLNAFFAFTVVLGMGVSWKIALGLVFIEGIIFIILSVVPIREMIVNCIPMSLKAAIAAGIGLFIAFIGLQSANIVVKNDAVLVQLGDIMSGPALIALIGLIVIGILHAYRVKGALLWGILIATVLGWVNGVTPALKGIIEWPSFTNWAPVFFKLDIAGAWNGIFSGGLLTVLIAFLFVDMFDTAGTLVGVSTQAGYLDEEGNLPKASKALLADAIGTTGGALFGTSTVTTYIESASGVSEGGRTGLTGVFVSIFFFLALFFKPLIGIIPAAATAPALIFVGTMMMKNATKIKWDDVTEMLPAFITMIAMPLTYSIAEGIALGFISYPLLKLLTGKGKEVHWLVYVLGVIFLVKYIWV